MASLFAGEPLQAPSYAATTTDVPKWLQDYTVDLFSQQRAVSGTPYQPYALPRIADVTAPTTAAQNLITSSSGAYQPTVQNAIAGTQGLAGATSVGNINAYMNPYTQNVTDQIAKLGARNLSENLLPQVSDQFIRAGQFGSSGMGTFGNRALRDTQESILANQTAALNTGYTQALGASQADLTRQQGALAQAGDLAKLQQGLTTADAAALESVGASQQAQQQKGLDVAYQDYQNQIAYPQTQINNMSATLRGLPATAVATTGTQTGSTTQFTPSPLSQIAGAFATYKGLTAAKGGLIDGYAEGGAVSGGEDLHGAVMADYGQYFKRGGMVPGYAEEGYVDTQDPAELVDGGQAFADQYAQGQLEYPTQQDASVMAAPTTSYMQDPEVMRANAERKALLKQLQTSLSTAPVGRDTGPTESEMWFNRAAAFLDPGKTGSFGEGLQHMTAVEAGHQAEKRKAKIANQAADLQRLQARSELAQKQYEMEMDEGKRRMIEQYLSPTPRSTDGGKVSGYDTGVPNNMRALLLSQEPADAVKTLVEMAKESNKPSDLIRGVKFLVANNSLTPQQGDAIIQENLQGKLEMVDVAIPELGGTFKLTGPEARTFYATNTLPTRLAPTTAPTAEPAQAAPAASRQVPLSQEQMEAKKTGLVEQSKADIAASGDLLAQKSFAKQQKDAANLVLGYATKSPKSFGILADPTFSNALASLVDTGVNTPWGSVGLAVEEPIAKLKLTGPEAAVRQLAAAPIALIEVGYRKMFLKGEGAVSNMEGALTKFIGPQLSDNAKTVQLKAGMITIGAEKQEKIVDAFEKYKEQHPESGPRSFYQTPEYKRINDSYETKYRSFAEKNGIPVAASTSSGSLADRIRQERVNRQNKEGK
jgi:hypothetical protein